MCKQKSKAGRKTACVRKVCRYHSCEHDNLQYPERTVTSRWKNQTGATLYSAFPQPIEIEQSKHNSVKVAHPRVYTTQRLYITVCRHSNEEALCSVHSCLSTRKTKARASAKAAGPRAVHSTIEGPKSEFLRELETQAPARATSMTMGIFITVNNLPLSQGEPPFKRPKF